MRFQLTPIPEVRAWGVDQILPDGARKRIKTFVEAERTEAVRLVGRLNGGRR